MYFLISGDINEQTATTFTRFLADCKAQNKRALLLINSSSGKGNALSQMIAAYQCSGVYMIAIGFGRLCNCAASIFCMANERILLPETQFALCAALPYPRTIPEKLFREKTAGNTYWHFSENEISQYGITTQYSEGWADLVAQVIGKEDDFSNVFQFIGDFTSELASAFILFLVQCKLHKTNALVLLNSGGGDIMQLQAILSAYRATGIRLTVVGTGVVGSCAASLFCMADERILAPGTQFIIHHASTELNYRVTLADLQREYYMLQKSEKILCSAYMRKTNITQETFEKRCANNANWELTEDEWYKYGVVTQNPESWIEILAKERTVIKIRKSTPHA